MASDRRSYVRIADSVIREPWDDATLADLVRLAAFLNTRWARDRLLADEAGDAFLRPQEIMLVTNTTHPTRARQRLLRLPERSGALTLSVAEEVACGVTGVRVRWPEFVEFQGYRDRDVPEPRGNLGAKRPPPHPQKQPHKKRSRAHARAQASEKALELSEHFAKRILEGPVQYAKAPTDLSPWAEDIDRMLRLDKIPVDEIRAVIDWATADSFWASHILSTRKLREKFPTLLANMRRPPNTPSHKDSVRGAVEILRGGRS